MRRRRWRLTALMLALMLVAAGCGGDDDDGGDTAAGVQEEVGESEGEVNIIAWAGYIERGDTDPKYDWVTEFEEESGCDVKVKTAGTSDEMASLMQEGSGYDLVTASGDASLRLIASGAVQPINLDLIESYDKVDERLQDAP